MNKTIRAFIAVEINSDIRAIIQNIIDSLRKSNSDVRWVKPNNLHVTLKFLGEIPEKKIEIVKDILRKISNKTPSIPTKLTPVNVFPHQQKPRVIWIGLEDREARIGKLATELENALSALGLPKEKKGLQAHITLGRLRSLKNTNSLMNKLQEASLIYPSEFTITHITLFRSTLTPEGSIYDVLEKLPLS